MKNLCFLSLIAALLFTACKDDDNSNKSQKNESASTISLTTAQKARVSEDNDFALDLLKQTISVSGEQNVIISPLSVSMALGMTWNGANGQTKTEMETALKMSGLSDSTINSYYQVMQNALPTLDPATKLSIANSIWYKTGFQVKQAFLSTNATYFNTYIKELDFDQSWAKDTINNWCAKKTNNLIPSVIDNIPSSAVMYLINAIYFKGTWTKKFDTKSTVVSSFTNELSQVNSINMMNIEDTFPYMKDNLAQYIDLPYGNKAYSMTVILPLSGKTTSDVLSSLNSTKFNEILNSLSNQKVDLYMPRFKTGSKFLMNNELQNMGMNLAFNSDLADLHRISDEQLFISKVIHNTQIEVNEDGTEAAAVTSVEVGTTAIMDQNIMRVDKPFIFVIRERSTGVILFAAKMGNVEKY
jgi:serpin B